MYNINLGIIVIYDFLPNNTSFVRLIVTFVYAFIQFSVGSWCNLTMMTS